MKNKKNTITLNRFQNECINDGRNRPYPHFKYPDEILIEVSPMTNEKCQWHNVQKGSFIFTCKNYGWFPTGIVMGVVNKFFTDTNNIGANIGSNLGSRSISIIDKDKAIKMLKKAGYNIEIK